MGPIQKKVPAGCPITRIRLRQGAGFSALSTQTNGKDGYVADERDRLGGAVGGAGVCLRRPQRQLYGLEPALCEHDGQLARTLHI